MKTLNWHGLRCQIVAVTTRKWPVLHFGDIPYYRAVPPDQLREENPLVNVDDLLRGVPVAKDTE